MVTMASMASMHQRRCECEWSRRMHPTADGCATCESVTAPEPDSAEVAADAECGNQHPESESPTWHRHVVKIMSGHRTSDIRHPAADN